MLTGAQIIVECLIEQGIDRVFGYPGGQVIPLYDALYEYSDRVKHILTAHEQGASHAADGYARSTGKVGVCIATSGPGATNLVTGLATAYMDSVPVVAITGNVPVNLLGKDSFQEVDITGVTLPITKHNFIVKKIEDLASTMRYAFEIAKSGRPGPVLVDIPKNIQTESIEFERAEVVDSSNKAELRDKDIAEAIKLIKKAEKPMLYVGGGVIRSDASELLQLFAELIDAPVGTSLMGLGAIPATNSRFTGMIGMHGTKLSNLAINSCDLLISVGARFSDRVISKASTFAKNAKIIQIDVDPAEFNKNIDTHVRIKGDVKDVLQYLISKIEEPLDHKKWMNFIEGTRLRYPQKVSTEAKRAKTIIDALERALPENRIITTEVGQHQMWAAQFYPFAKPRTFLTSGGLGTMGYGTGAAIGAQVANPDKKVVHFAGDGSFRMNCNELATIGHYNLPIIIVVLNNGTLGMVRQWQNLFYQKHYSQTTLDFGPDFVKLAEAYGIQGFRATSEQEFKDAFNKASASGKPAIIDTMIDVDEMVLPMVPAGKPIEELLLEVNK